MKKRFAVLLLLLLAAIVLPAAASAATSGTCGSSLRWTLNDSGVLTISGSGTMTDYDLNTSPAPWGTSVTQAIIQQGVTSIGSQAFRNCGSMTSVQLPDSLTSIGFAAFYYCTALKEVTIPNSVTALGEGAFSKCTGMTKLTISNRAKYLAEGVFSGCSSLTSVTIPQGVESIGDSAFYYCDRLKTVTIPGSVKRIGNFVFMECGSLESVTIPEGVTRIGNGLFSRCGSLKKVMCPKSITTYGCNAFSSCSSNLTVYCYPGVMADAGESEGFRVKLRGVEKLVITTQPKDVKVGEGKKATFKVVATGADSYQWYYRTSSCDPWKKCSGGTGASRSVTAKASYSGYQYRCLLKNAGGSVYSSTVTLTVKPKPVITVQPKSKTVNEGGRATFKVTATGASSYQWYYRKSATGTWQKSGSSAAAAASFSFTAKATHNGYQYRCLVKNSAGSVFTKIASLTVKLKPVITAQPKSASVTAGKKATFKVTAEGAESYQWYVRKSSGGVWQKCSGSTAVTAAFSFTVKAGHNGYQYRCLVKNGAGSVYTGIASLKVK